MSHGQYILIGQTAVPCDDLLGWGEWMEHADRRVRLTQVGDWFVTTVFLGLDHNWSRGGPPILFETMAYRNVEPYELFGLKVTRKFRDDIQERCATWLEAEAQHERVVAQLRQPGVVEVRQIEPEPLPEEKSS